MKHNFISENKFPIVLFLTSLFGGLIITSLSHFSMNAIIANQSKINSKNYSKFDDVNWSINSEGSFLQIIKKIKIPNCQISDLWDNLFWFYYNSGLTHK